MSEYKYANEYEEQETKKYEGLYTSEEIALNKQLYEECSKEVLNLAFIEELLKKGADPLGSTAEYGWGLLEHVYGELMLDSQDFNSINLPRITELFLKYGMDVSSPRVPYDGENSLHVLSFFPANENSIVALKMLLDHGADADSVGEIWDRYIFDEYNVCQDDPNAEEWHGRFVWMMKIIMLIASYDHVLNRDEGLKELIGVSYNSYDIHRFQNWNDYDYEFDTSRCERFPELYRSVLKIYETKTKKAVWKIGFCLKEGEF